MVFGRVTGARRREREGERLKGERGEGEGHNRGVPGFVWAGGRRGWRGVCTPLCAGAYKHAGVSDLL